MKISFYLGETTDILVPTTEETSSSPTSKSYSAALPTITWPTQWQHGTMVSAMIASKPSSTQTAAQQVTTHMAAASSGALQRRWAAPSLTVTAVLPLPAISATASAGTKFPNQELATQP